MSLFFSYIISIIYYPSLWCRQKIRLIYPHQYLKYVNIDDSSLIVVAQRQAKYF